MIIAVAIYVWRCFSSIAYTKNEEKRNRILRRQRRQIFLVHFLGFADIYLVTQNTAVLFFYGAQIVLFLVIFLVYDVGYRHSARLLLNNMCMLLAIGFIIQTRLNFDNALKQFAIAAASSVLTLLFPFFVHKISFLRNLKWLYAIVGIGLLLVVAVVGPLTYGANLSITVAGVTLQPSEFVKILFVFFAASILSESTEFQQIVKATVVAAMHVLILVVSKDLGAALIFFVVYLVMLYVATKKISYVAAGAGAGAAASVVAYKLFSHIRVRVTAWKDPFAANVINNDGYQIAQSLFAIGTGGWFGLGLYQGMPSSIPVVEQDSVFAAISEEMGGLFAICLIMICMSCIVMMFNISMQMRDEFYKLVALGLGAAYGFQVFLTIGGITKFIPLTGVTLPFVSSGGSSLLSSMIEFAIVQGLYILKQKEGTGDEKTKKRNVKSNGRNRKKRKGNQTGTKKTGSSFDLEDLN
jgi:cell division protein FtsW (lipid II flippase)